MVAFLTESEDCSVSKTDREQAWSVSRALLNLGRPSRPAELASMCQVSHDFVKFLCSIPDSPLCLTDDLYVTISGVGEFELKAIYNFVPRISLSFSETKRSLDNVISKHVIKRKGQKMVKFLLPSAKRRRLLSSPEIDDDNLTRLALADSILSVSSSKAHVDFADKLIRNMSFLRGGLSIQAYDSEILNQYRAVTPLLLGYNVDCPSNGLMKIDEDDRNEAETNIVVQGQVPGSVCTPEHQHSFLNNEIDTYNPNAATEETQEYELRLDLKLSTIGCNETRVNQTDFEEKIVWTATTSLKPSTQCDNSQEDVVIPDTEDSEASRSRIQGTEAIDSGKGGQIIIKARTDEGGQGDNDPIGNAALKQEPPKAILGSLILVNYSDKMSSPEREKTTAHVETQAVIPLAEISTVKMQSTRSSSKLKSVHKDTTLRLGVLSDSQNCNKAVNSFEQQEQYKRECMPMKQKLKQNCNPNVLTKENRIDSTPIAPKNQSEPKALPDFESFIIEEEEGSGGYGTVYRARRKNDGKTFAIKCPHVNAHVHHVNNELRMLERFGGRNFVIKYESSFKWNNSECFVLEHVQHDRPEVLKRDIDIYDLQWYGYCMFRALASLHKQGIVHRDVKPGNFLFSRKLSKGYLIDFNLAMDLHQKYCATSKSKMSPNVSIDNVPLPSTKSAPPIKGRKVASSRFLETSKQEVSRDSKPSLEPKSMKKRADVVQSKAYLDLGNRHKLKTQGADGSGVTSTKDVTSTRTPSGERQRERVLVHGRKELISFAEAIHSPNQKGINFPASQRKRVAATPGKVDKKLFYLTPMPVHSTGSAVAGAGLFKNKGDAKQKREGPCVGTKGFRAPEVLFKSPHQGPKVDVWSAGVTLLYLMIGKSPFIGDPEQNIKDIAKLRGSEDLWEVAKLHNRESSFPVELLDIQSLPSMKLQEWCQANTKRPEFLDEIPRSLFDLVDKCLTVNPRLRISAEEALNHEFFASCHERLRKQRLLRQRLSVDSESANLSQEHI